MEAGATRCDDCTQWCCECSECGAELIDGENLNGVYAETDNPLYCEGCYDLNSD